MGWVIMSTACPRRGAARVQRPVHGAARVQRARGARATRTRCFHLFCFACCFNVVFVVV